MDPKESKKKTGGVGSPLGMHFASAAIEERKTGLDAAIDREKRREALDPNRNFQKPSVYAYNPKSPDFTSMVRPRSQSFLKEIR